MASPHLTMEEDEMSISESSIEFCPMSPESSSSSSKPIKLQSRLDIFQEKMHVSDSSVEFVWEEDECSEEPIMKAISKMSLGLEDSCREQQEETRRVRFSADIDCQAYLHIMDYSLKESMSCFYTNDERSHMAATRDYIIAKIDRGINEEAEDEFLRGLEYWCQDSCRAIDRRVNAVIQLIMDEQDRQIDNNILDEYTISISAQTVTAKSAKVARKIAKEDARLAQEAYFDMAHNGTIKGYMMPATLCTFEPTKTKKKTKRGKASKRRSKVEESVASDAAIDAPSEEVSRSEEFTVRKRVKKQKKRRNSAPANVILEGLEAKSTKKKNKKERRSTMSMKRKLRKARSTSDVTDDKSASSSKKSKRSSSSKSSKKSKSSTKKKTKRSSKSTAATDDKDTVTTAPVSQENLVINKQEHGSLSSNEDDTFLISTKKRLPIKPPARRHILTGPVAATNDSPMLERGFSWWNLKV